MLDAFQTAITGEPLARVTPKRLVLYEDADLTQLKTNPRVYPSEKSSSVKEHLNQLL